MSLVYIRSAWRRVVAGSPPPGPPPPPPPPSPPPAPPPPPSFTIPLSVVTGTGTFRNGWGVITRWRAPTAVTGTTTLYNGVNSDTADSTVILTVTNPVSNRWYSIATNSQQILNGWVVQPSGQTSEFEVDD